MIRHSLVTASVVALLVSLVACGNDETGDAATTVSPTTVVDEPAEAVIERDLAYGTYHGLTLTLDLYLPADPSDAPIVIEPWESFAEQIAQEGAISVLLRTGIPDLETGDPGEARLSEHGALMRAEAEQAACAMRFARARAFLASAIGAHPELEVRLIHGTEDFTIPMENSVEFETALTDAGYDVRLVTFDGGHHDPPNELSLEVFKEALGL